MILNDLYELLNSKFAYMATRKVSTKKTPSQKKSPSIKSQAIKDQALHAKYDLSFILNPLVVNQEAVVKSNLSSTELDITQGRQASGHVKTFSEHDEGNHLKLFLVASNKESIFKLPNRAMALYLWILYTINHKTDIITIDPMKCCSDINMSENTLRSAIKDLEKAKIIHRIGVTQGAVNYYDFYVNSLFMFRGKRFDYYRRFLAKYNMYRNDKDRGLDFEED